MLQTYKHGVSSGTAANRIRQASLYVKFALYYNFNFLFPHVVDILMYTQFLKNSFNSPISVKNYISGAKGWVVRHNGNLNAFESVEVKEMLSAVVNISTHVPMPASPLTPDQIKTICDYIDSQPQIPRAIKPCILFTYVCFLRGSNVISPTSNSWGGPHTLLVSDVVMNPLGLVLIIRSTKTMKGTPPVTLQILKVQDSKYCPVQAWLTYKLNCKPFPLGPAFMIDSVTSLTPRHVVTVMRQALIPVLGDKVSGVSMHSLRRSGTQTAANAGASTQELMKHGTWTSRKGLKYYLPKKPDKVPTILAQSLA